MAVWATSTEQARTRRATGPMGLVMPLSDRDRDLVCYLEGEHRSQPWRTCEYFVVAG